MTESFQDYAIQRLARSGIAIDPSFVKFHHNDNTRSLSIPEVHDTVLCIGSNDCFWLILVNDVGAWIREHNTHRVPLTKVSGKKISFLELPPDLPGSCFTPIPDNYFTEYESLVWLEDHRDTFKRILEIMNNNAVGGIVN